MAWYRKKPPPSRRRLMKLFPTGKLRTNRPMRLVVACTLLAIVFWCLEVEHIISVHQRSSFSSENLGDTPIETTTRTSLPEGQHSRAKESLRCGRPELPNILLLVTDQFRHDAFDPLVTPHLHALASSPRTTLFSHAYSSTPTCTPSRAALLTGKSPWNHGMLGYADAVSCERYPTTLPGVLADRLGYETAVVGKNHFGTKPAMGDGGPASDRRPRPWCRARHTEIARAQVEKEESSDAGNQTFASLANQRRFIDHGYQHMKLYDGLTLRDTPDDYDRFFDRHLPGVDPLSTCHLGWNDWQACPYEFDEYLHPTAWTTRQALRAIDERVTDDEGPPVFLKVSYHRPHSPYDPPKRLWDKHAARSQSQEHGHRYARNIGSTDGWDRAFFVNHTTSDNPPMDPEAWQGDPGDEMARRSRAAYLANVEFIDEGVGRILERLRSTNHYENTLVVWTSDHGDMLGDHNLWRKGYPWEASARVNMVMKLPADTPMDPSSEASVSDAIVEIRDVAPTIYDLLGILDNVTSIDPLVNGKSLLPVLKRSTASVRPHLDLEHSTVYDDRIHWNAIVGRRPKHLSNATNDCDLYKYVFFARDGTEQLFCLSEDPRELDDLAPLPAHAPMLSFWRSTMARGFAEEGRGEEWVTPQGDLVVRESGSSFGKNYPCGPGDEISGVAYE